MWGGGGGPEKQTRVTHTGYAAPPPVQRWARGRLEEAALANVLSSLAGAKIAFGPAKLRRNVCVCPSPV